MAIVRLVPTGVYGVCDLEKVTSDFTGQGIMQEAELDATDFASAVLENGQCVVVAGGKVKNPALTSKVLLNFTASELYEDGKGRETFAVKRGVGSQPRLMGLAPYDVFSTNCVVYDDAEFATLSALKTAIIAGTVKAVPTITRDWKLTATVGTATMVGEVIAYTTLSNDRDGVRIRIQA